VGAKGDAGRAAQVGQKGDKGNAGRPGSPGEFTWFLYTSSDIMLAAAILLKSMHSFVVHDMLYRGSARRLDSILLFVFIYSVV